MDHSLADILAMGAIADDDEEGAINLALHAKQASKLTGMKGFDVMRRWVSILTRYWYAMREQFHPHGKMVISFDGSRFQSDTEVGIAGSYKQLESEFVTAVLPPQVARDFMTERSTEHEKDEDALTEEDWFVLANAFLESSFAEDDEDLQRARKKRLYRLKAFEFCLVLENWLWLLRQHGLANYIDTRFNGSEKQVMKPHWPEMKANNERAPDRDWLWVVTDRASTNMSPVCYLTYDKHCRVPWYGDTNHDVGNETKGGAIDAGFGDLFKVLMVIANCVYGPFDSGGFWTKTLDSARDYKNKIGDLYFACSRSWLKWGELGACALVCEQAWKHRVLPCPHKWIKDKVAGLQKTSP